MADEKPFDWKNAERAHNDLMGEVGGLSRVLDTYILDYRKSPPTNAEEEDRRRTDAKEALDDVIERARAILKWKYFSR